MEAGVSWEEGIIPPLTLHRHVKYANVWEQDNVELLSIEMPEVVIHSVYKPPNEKFVRKPTPFS